MWSISDNISDGKVHTQDGMKIQESNIDYY